MSPELAHLKALIEGAPNLPRWRPWFEEHAIALEALMSRGQFLRVKHYPTKEIPNILREHGITFVPSTSYEWLDWDSTSGRCRECGAILQRVVGRGGGFAMCPNGCTMIAWDNKLSSQNADDHATENKDDMA